MSYRDPMTKIMRERERLLALCGAQRTEIAVLARQWESALTVVDRAVAGIGYLRQHPVVLGMLVTLLTVIQRRGLWGWARRGFELWSAYRALRAIRNSKVRFTA